MLLYQIYYRDGTMDSPQPLPPRPIMDMERAECVNGEQECWIAEGGEWREPSPPPAPSYGTIRARAFGGRLEQIRVMVDPTGTVRVYDDVAGHYTTCHSLSTRDLSRARKAAFSN
jgi:hypothetical protein